MMELIRVTPPVSCNCLFNMRGGSSARGRVTAAACPRSFSATLDNCLLSLSPIGLFDRGLVGDGVGDLINGQSLSRLWTEAPASEDLPLGFAFFFSGFFGRYV